MDSRDNVPGELRTWFVIHFAADMAFAVPLFLVPRQFLTLLGWREVDPVATRLVAAALFGIGIQSLLGRNERREPYLAMLNLKIIWSLAAVLGLAISLGQGGPAMAWAFLFIFAVFCALWSTWRLRLARSAKSSLPPPSPSTEEGR